MSHEEVADVRPFSYEQSVTKSTGDTPTVYALVDRAYVDGATMSLQVSFRNEKAHKIVSRISPDFFENVFKKFLALGCTDLVSTVFFQLFL